VSALPVALKRQLGAGGGPGNVARPHWPVVARGESSTTVALTGIASCATGYPPFRPDAPTSTCPGTAEEARTVTRRMPWMPPRPFAYFQLVRDGFTFQPVLVA